MPFRLTRTGTSFLHYSYSELALAEQRRDSTVVLVIDEAQCMPLETLEGIRMLSNLETANEQIVLMGQPELETVLDATNCAMCGNESPFAQEFYLSQQRKAPHTSSIGSYR